MLKLIKNQVNRVELVVSSTIDISGFSAKLTIDSTDSIIPDISVNSPTFEVQQAAVDSLGECNALLPLEIIDTKGSVYSTVKVAARAVDTPVGVLRNDQRIFTVLVGDIASPNEHNVALEAEIEARKLADTLVLRDAKDYTDKKFGEAKIFVYAGQVDTVADLPEDAEAGAVYNVLSTGANYVWNGEAWDKLSENIDLSIFAKASQLTEEINARSAADTAIQNTLNEEINTRSSQVASITKLVEANSEAITNLKEAVPLKADKTDVESLQTEVGKLSTEVGTKASASDLKALETTVGTKADKATTLEGYGITDAATKTEVAAKADKADLDLKANKATTLEGYGITDAATKTEVAAKADKADLAALAAKVDAANTELEEIA